MKKFKLSYGLGGGFGGANEIDEVYEYENEDEAMQEAYLLACEEYDSYAGMYGLPSIDDIIEQDDVDEDEAWEIYREERESWLDYDVVEVEEDDIKGEE